MSTKQSKNGKAMVYLEESSFKDGENSEKAEEFFKEARQFLTAFQELDKLRKNSGGIDQVDSNDWQRLVRILTIKRHSGETIGVRGKKNIGSLSEKDLVDIVNKMRKQFSSTFGREMEKLIVEFFQTDAVQTHFKEKIGLMIVKNQTRHTGQEKAGGNSIRGVTYNENVETPAGTTLRDGVITAKTMPNGSDLLLKLGIDFDKLEKGGELGVSMKRYNLTRKNQPLSIAELTMERFWPYFTQTRDVDGGFGIYRLRAFELQQNEIQKGKGTVGLAWWLHNQTIDQVYSGATAKGKTGPSGDSVDIMIVNMQMMSVGTFLQMSTPVVEVSDSTITQRYMNGAGGYNMIPSDQAQNFINAIHGQKIKILARVNEQLRQRMTMKKIQ